MNKEMTIVKSESHGSGKLFRIFGAAMLFMVLIFFLFASQAEAAEVGWVKKDGNWYYIKEDGTNATGWIYVDGNYYFMDPNGVMQTGWKKVQGKWYYLKPNGAMATGWITDEGERYYLNPETGEVTVGWLQLSDGWHYFNTKGEEGNVTIDDTHFPDAAFRNALKNEEIDRDQNNKLSMEEINAITESYLIILHTTGTITNLKGIEFFTAMTKLDIFGRDDVMGFDECQLKSVDLSKNLALEDLQIRFQPGLTKVNLSQNKNLTSLDCTDCEALTSIDFGDNPSISEFYLARTNVTNLDLRKFSALQKLNISQSFDLEWVWLPKTTHTITVGSFMMGGLTIIDARGCNIEIMTNKTWKNEAAYITSNAQLGWMESPYYYEFSEDGIFDQNEYLCYYLEDGDESAPLKLHKGWLETELGRFYFNDQGVLQNGLQTIGGEHYLFYSANWEDSSINGSFFFTRPTVAKKGDRVIGAALTGWVSSQTFEDYPVNIRHINPQYYSEKIYCDSTGKMLSGMQKIDGKDYLFVPATETGERVNSAGEVLPIIGYSVLCDAYVYVDSGGDISRYPHGDGLEDVYFTNKDGSLFSGWYYDSHYSEKDHKLERGFFTVDGKRYYADENVKKASVKKSGFFTVGGKTYYADREDGHLVTGFVEKDAKTYYLGEDYTLCTGLITVGKNHYYADANGKIEKSSWRTNGDGTKYFWSNWIELDGKSYLPDENGVFFTGAVDVYRNGGIYFFDENGAARAHEMIEYKKKTCITTSLGYPGKGDIVWNGKTYYAGDDGWLQKGVIKRGTNVYYYGDDYSKQVRVEFDGETPQYYTVNVGGKTYIIFNESGQVSKSGWYRNVYPDGWDFYLKNYQPVTGLQKISEIYYFDQEGHLVKGPQMLQIENGTIYIGNPNVKTGRFSVTTDEGKRSYFADEWGYLQKGLFTDNTGEEECLCLAGEDFVLAEGFTTWEGKLYYASPSYPVGKVSIGWFKIKKNNNPYDTTYNTYYADQNGVVAMGPSEIDGAWYFFDEQNGLTGGWQTVDGSRYLFNEDGTAVNGWLEEDGVWRYFFKSGKMVTSWTKINKNWFYFDREGVMQTGWVRISGKWYYFDANGHMKTGWLLLSGKWYYLDDNGRMQTGWLSISGKWYYFEPNGKMVTGWKQINNKWYYFKEKGEMAVGWITVSGNWYFMEAGVMATGWKKIQNKWYYFYPGGKMAVSTTVGKYKIGADGVCINP